MEPTRKFRPRDKVIFALGCFVLLISMVGEVGIVAKGLTACDDPESKIAEFEWDDDDFEPREFFEKWKQERRKDFDKRRHGPGKFLNKWGHGPDNVKVAGAWNVEIIKGDDFDVRIDGLEGTRDYVDIDRRFHTLILKSKAPPETERATVRITMPELETLKADGATHVVIKGFHQREMEINASGASEIIAEHGTVYELDLKTSGAAKVNFRKCPTQNADIKLTGATRLDLTMAGGSLEGKISGSSQITYYGDVDEIDIKSSGSSGVRGG